MSTTTTTSANQNPVEKICYSVKSIVQQYTSTQKFNNLDSCIQTAIRKSKKSRPTTTGRPVYGQTREGVYLLVGNYGSLGTILDTPYGRVHLCSSSSSICTQKRKELQDELIKELGLVLVEEGDYEGGSHVQNNILVPNKRTHCGFFGPWYQITSPKFPGICTRSLSTNGPERSSGAHYDFYQPLHAVVTM